MADLRSRFIEDYAGGLLNIARQELATTGEVLSQDGLTSEGTIFVEDGSGVKSGLKLGVSLAEVVDPTTETGIVNVRYADRTYAKIRDLKIFSTAIASSQAALSEATSISISNLETSVQFLEDDLGAIEQNFQRSISQLQEQVQGVNLSVTSLEETINTNATSLKNLENRVISLENPQLPEVRISTLSTTLNQIYYSGTVTINGAQVTGTSTQFAAELAEGSIIVAMVDGKDVEFRVTSITNNTSMTVTPTDKIVTSAIPFRRNAILELKNKVNEIIAAMRQLKFIV